jgi:uncharacterized protein
MAERLDPVASRQPDTATRSSPTIDTAAPRLRLSVLQPTPFCNIDCSYCYLPNRKSAARMSLDTLDLACQRVFESPFLDRQLEVAWHGGEPLTVPLAWYDEASALMALRCPAELKLKHRFQTNGLLVNDDWARFFARSEAKVGLSIDVRKTSTTPAAAPVAAVERTRKPCTPPACCRIAGSGST